MHMVIAAIVYADDAAEALEQAKVAFDGLVKDQHPFDYYVTFDEDGQGMSGKDRWGGLKPAALTTSPEGKKLLDDLVKIQKRELFGHLDEVRKGLQRYTNDDFWNEAAPTKAEIEKLRAEKGETVWDAEMVRYHMFHAGEYTGNATFLYSKDGEGIRAQPSLDRFLTEYNEGRPVWIVPADVHS